MQQQTRGPATRAKLISAANTPRTTITCLRLFICESLHHANYHYESIWVNRCISQHFYPKGCNGMFLLAAQAPLREGVRARGMGRSNRLRCEQTNEPGARLPANEPFARNDGGHSKRTALKDSRPRQFNERDQPTHATGCLTRYVQVDSRLLDRIDSIGRPETHQFSLAYPVRAEESSRRSSHY